MAKLVDVESIASYFQSLSDPRHTRNRKHRLVDIAVIGVAAIICGCDGPTAIHRWAVNRADWLAERLPLENGIPSRDCIRRVLMALKPEAFQQCFPNWIAAARPAENDADVTIDAMGCQKEIVEQVVAGGGDCVIAVKANQPKLHAAIAAFFNEQLERDFEDLRYRHAETTDDGHGRSDERAYFLAKLPRDFGPADDWPDIQAIGYAIRLTTHADGRESCEARYYVSSRCLSGKRFAEAVRSHWAIESMHWVLDVTFREDDSRTRERTLGNNLSWLRRFAVTLLQRHPINDSIRGKMLRCGYNTDFLTEVLELQSD